MTREPLRNERRMDVDQFRELGLSHLRIGGEVVSEIHAAQVSAANLVKSTAALFANHAAPRQIADMKRKAQRSKLEVWQQEDAKRLRDLIDDAKKQPDWKNLDDFAERAGVGTQSNLSQLSNGYRPLNLEKTMALAKALRVAVARISPHFAGELASAPPAYDDATKPEPARSERNGEADALDTMMINSLRTLHPELRQSIRTLVTTVAMAQSASYADWSRRREAEVNRRSKKKSTASEG